MAVIHSLLRHSACMAPAVSHDAVAPICCRAKAVAAGLRMPMARLAPMKGRNSWPAATEAVQE